MRKRIGFVLTALVSAVAAATTAFAVGGSVDSGGHRSTGGENLGDPEYGVCRGTNPRCYHDWGNLDLSKGAKVLVYSRTAGPRHDNLGPALEEGMNPPLSEENVAQKGLVRLGKENGFSVDWTEDVSELSSASALFDYHAVIFLSTTRDALDDSAQTALRQYVRGGGGFVGIHNAFGTEYNWPWYEGLLGGANYYDHGPAQPGTVRVVNHRDASTSKLPERWKFSDEWYNLVPAPSKVRVLARVDESSMPEGPRGSMGHPGHGAKHPVAWCQYYDGGRAWLTTLGHDSSAFADPDTEDGSAYFQSMLVGGIKSAAGMTPFCR